MIALHAVWSRDDQLCVWGEDSALPARAPKRRGRAAAKPRPRAHPFAAAMSELRRALDGLGLAVAPGACADGELTLMLRMTGGLFCGR